MSGVGAQAIAELDRWFRERWEESRDFKEELIELLDATKFGQMEYTPYQVYMKALFEYFKDDLGAAEAELGKSAVELSEFQEDAVKKARRVLARYDGVLIGDSVGLGKTWIGKKLLEDHAYHLRQKALVICPASLRQMWTGELRDATIAGSIVSQEELGQAGFDPGPSGDADVILIDESHNFRNRTTQRYENLERIIGANGRRGRDGSRKKLIMLTATPINNNIFDLYNQITLITGGDRSYFSGAGIGDLYRFFLNARRNVADHETGVALFNLLEEVVIRRTRAFVRKTYPEAMIKGEHIKWPKRYLKTVRYDLESTYKGNLRPGCSCCRRPASGNLPARNVQEGRCRAGRVRAGPGGSTRWHLQEPLPEALRVQRGRLPNLCAAGAGVHQDLRELSAGRQAPRQHVFPEVSAVPVPRG